MMTKIVDMRIEALLPKYDGCRCATCIDDMRCLTLNKLPSKYVNTQKGELFSKVEQLMQRQSCVDLDIAVMLAMEIVKTHPRCETMRKKAQEAQNL